MASLDTMVERSGISSLFLLALISSLAVTGACGDTKAQQESLAVLPFVDDSPARNQAGFADGLTDELIHELSQIQGLRVPGRASCFYLKGKQIPIREVGQQLKVNYVLEGTVTNVGSRWRISADLIRVSSDEHVWGRTYDEDADAKNWFLVQDKIARSVVEALKLKFAASPQTSPRRANDTAAYSHYLLGRKFLNQGDVAGNTQAVSELQQSIDKDPTFALAYTDLALAENRIGQDAGDLRMLDSALSHAEKAIALAPQMADGYAARGWLRTNYAWDWNGALTDFTRALSLDSRNSITHRHYGLLLATLGRYTDAVSEATEATTIDPFATGAWENLALAYIAQGNLTEADKAVASALQLAPDSEYALELLGELQLIEGHPRDALKTYSRVHAGGRRLYGSAIAYYSLGEEERFTSSLDQLTPEDKKGFAYEIATAYAWGGEHDKAFEWLDRAYSQRDGGLIGLKYDPLLHFIRDDTRFSALLTNMKLSK